MSLLFLRLLTALGARMLSVFYLSSLLYPRLRCRRIFVKWFRFLTDLYGCPRPQSNTSQTCMFQNNEVSCYTICRACYHVTRIASPSTDDGTALLTLYVKYNVLAFFVLHFFVLDPSSLGPGAEPLPKAT